MEQEQLIQQDQSVQEALQLVSEGLVELKTIAIEPSGLDEEIIATVNQEKQKRKRRKQKPKSPSYSLTVPDLKDKLVEMHITGISRMSKDALVALYDDQVKKEKRRLLRKAVKDAKVQELRDGLQEHTYAAGLAQVDEQ